MQESLHFSFDNGSDRHNDGGEFGFGFNHPEVRAMNRSLLARLLNLVTPPQRARSLSSSRPRVRPSIFDCVLEDRCLPSGLVDLHSKLDAHSGKAKHVKIVDDDTLEAKQEQKAEIGQSKLSKQELKALREANKPLRRKEVKGKPPGGGISILSNQAPGVNAGPTLYGCECQPVTLAGYFTDPDGPGNYTLQINWGDGSTEQFTFFSPSSFAKPHTYADDGSYTITVNATDGLGATGTGTTTAQIATIQTVEWVASPLSPLDTNPNIGGGKRIFPDKLTGLEDPMLAAFRRQVKVRATLTTPALGVIVHFKIFDVDDPSSNLAPVDNDGTWFQPPAAADNRIETGSPMEATVQTVAGPGGTAIAEFTFTVSMQPGNNYRVVATCHLPALYGLYARQDDSPQARIYHHGADGQQYTADDTDLLNDRVKVAVDMLTVWRRLHVEVDSMGTVEGNDVSGVIASVVPHPEVMGYSIATVTIGGPGLFTGDASRFENGWLTDFFGQSFRVIANTAPGNTFEVTVQNNPDTGAVPSLGNFTMVDDDVVTGNIPMPDTGKLSSAMNEAYVTVLFDVGVAHDNVPFHANLSYDEGVQGPNNFHWMVETYWDSRMANASNFWVAYLLGTFQGLRTMDNDPTMEFSDLGATGIAKGGSSIPHETIADWVREWNASAIPSEQVSYQLAVQDSVVHEIAHAVANEEAHPVTGLNALVLNQRPPAVPHNEPGRYLPAYLDFIRRSPKPRGFA